MVPVRLSRLRVAVDAEHYTVARRLQAKAQPAGPAEQVSREAVPVCAQPCRVRQEVVFVALLGVRGKLDERPSDQPDAVLAALGTLGAPSPMRPSSP